MVRNIRFLAADVVLNQLQMEAALERHESSQRGMTMFHICLMLIL